NACALQNLSHIVRTQEGQVVPAFKVGINPRRHGRKQLVHRSSLRVRAQLRRDQLPYDPRIEGIACQPKTAVSQKVFRGPSPSMYARAYTQQGKVAGSSAEVSNENQFVVVNRGLVGIRCGNRLKFKFDMLESSECECLPQPIDGKFVLLRRLCA